MSIGTEFYNKKHLGFINPERADDKAVDNDIKLKLKQTFRTEFLNRIDEVIFFKHLNPEGLTKIALNMLDGIRKQLEQKTIYLNVKDKALELLSKEGCDLSNGARPLKRAIDRLIVKPLSDKLLVDEFVEEDIIIVDVEDGRIVFSK